jgi:hypothetical protein
MTADPEKEEMIAWLADKNLEHATDYAARGRAYAQLTLDELTAAFTAAFHEYVQDPTGPGRATEADLESEFRLRRRFISSPPISRSLRRKRPKPVSAC